MSYHFRKKKQRGQKRLASVIAQREKIRKKRKSSFVKKNKKPKKLKFGKGGQWVDSGFESPPNALLGKKKTSNFKSQTQVPIVCNH